MSIKNFLQEFQNVLAALAGGTTALIAFIEFDNLVPEPIDTFNVYGTIILVIGIILSFVFLSIIIKWIKLIISILILNLIILIIFQTVFISKVVYGDERTLYVFHGVDTKMLELEKYASHVDIIKDVGPDFDSLNMAYSNFHIWVLSYQLALLSFLILFIISIAGGMSAGTKNPSKMA